MRIFSRQGYTNDNAKSSAIEKVVIFIIVFCVALFTGNYLASKGIFLVKTSSVVKEDVSKLKDTSKYSALFEVRDTLKG